MAITDRLNIADKIIQKLTELTVLFDEWVQKIKANELPEAAEIVKKSNILRTEITILKKDYAKLNKLSAFSLGLNPGDKILTTKGWTTIKQVKN